MTKLYENSSLLACLLVGLFFAVRPGLAQKLSPLAPPPNWQELEVFQETITAAEFRRLLDQVYAQGNTAKEVIEVAETEARIVMRFGKPERFVLRFARTAEKAKAPERYWRPAEKLDPAKKGNSLLGVKIALDPGHVGGEWAQMEERWFQLGKSQPVQEGSMTLLVANLLAPMLEKEGAEVFLVRSLEEPITARRPLGLLAEAKASLEQRGVTKPKLTYNGHADPTRETSILWESEKLFYRISEIRDRAEIVNEKIQPDMTVCLHFNAEPWGDPANPALLDANHLHLLINGCYSPGELAYDDIRFDMLVKLLNRSYYEELAASKVLADVLAQETGLPPYQYLTPNAKLVPSSHYIWTRNLLANRLFHCPVLFLEPYVMNNRTVFRRVELGNYPGEMVIEGTWRKSIYREYAEAVRDGLAQYFTRSRKR